MNYTIQDHLNQIDTASKWNETLDEIKAPVVGWFGARRYCLKNYEGSLSYNDLVKKTETIFQKDANESVLETLKTLDRSHLNRERYTAIFFYVLKALHGLKSLCGRVFYDKNNVIKKLTLLKDTKIEEEKRREERDKKLLVGSLEERGRKILEARKKERLREKKYLKNRRILRRNFNSISRIIQKI